MTREEITYLLGCHLVVADAEINSREVAVNEAIIDEDSAVEAERSKIFSDADDRLPAETLAESLRELMLPQPDRLRTLSHLIEVAYGDEYYDPSEKALVHMVADRLGVPEEDVARLESEISQRSASETIAPLSWTQRLQGLIDGLNYELNMSEGRPDVDDIELLSGYGFAKKISDITENAVCDLRRSTVIIEDTTADLNLFLREIKRISTEMEHAKRASDNDMEAVLDSLKAICDKAENLIGTSLKELIRVQQKKERNIRYFTIAFMGRTKTGKSTLHKVVTHETKDDIGSGKLRTTRYNRSWFWEKLRIVDTPGIGAPGGKSDAEIASSIIDEADLICYIVTNDSIQTTEFDFLEALKERNKPLYIILNYKSNLLQGLKMRRFMEEPDKWLREEGEKSIKGHYTRIREMLSGKYNINAVHIIPLHLLAAQMYYESDAAGKELLEGSNIREFIASVKRTVFRSGTLKKSMSVIDGCAHQLHEIDSVFSADFESLRSNLDLLKKKRGDFSTFLTRETDKLRRDIATVIKTKFKELRNRASSFSEDEYDNKNAGEDWGRDSVVRSIHKRMETLIRERSEEYSQKVKDRIEELVADISIEINLTGNDRIQGRSTFNTKLAAGIVSAIGFAVLNIWNPLGWGTLVLTGIGLALSAIVGLFKSKESKIREAKSKLESALLDNLRENEAKALSDADRQISASYVKLRENIDGLLDEFISRGDMITSAMDNHLRKIRANENVLNSLLGARILDHILKCPFEDINAMSNEEIADRIKMKREWSRGIFIFTGNYKLSESDIHDAESVSQMTILNQND